MKDNSWERFGKNDPYFAVLTYPQFKSANLNADALDEFFKSGEAYADQLISNLQKSFSLHDLSTIKNVLEFGCGTGRIMIPLAKRFESITGVDISESMLKEAKK